jgi:hypothetical protein
MEITYVNQKKMYLDMSMAPAPTTGTTQEETPHNCGDIEKSRTDPLMDEFKERMAAARVDVKISADFSRYHRVIS